MNESPTSTVSLCIFLNDNKGVVTQLNVKNE